MTPPLVGWADDLTAVIEGNPLTGTVLVGPSHTRGDLGLGRMLNPRSLEALVPPPWTSSFEIEGGALEGDFGIAPEFTTLSAERYEVEFDEHHQVITAWRAFIDGQLAHRQQLVRLTELT